MEKKRNIASAAALVVGVIFVVLAGAIFATTTWRVMPSFAKVTAVFVLAVLFFAVSEAADRFLQIHRTANACYLLGCIFLFLTVAAAGYFKLLGPVFLGKGGGWRVFSLGSIVMSAAMFMGIRRFSDGLYTQLCLWSVTVNAALLMKVFGCSGTAFINGMAVYASLLMVFCLRIKRHVGPFVMIHFILFGVLLMLSCGMEYFLLMLGEELGSSKEGIWHVGGNLLTMAMVAGTSALFVWKEKQLWGKISFQAVMAELIHYGVMAAVQQFDIYQHPDRVFFMMAALTSLFFLTGRRLLTELRCGAGDVILGFVQLGDTVFLSVFALLGSHMLFPQLEVGAALLLLVLILREWGKKYLPVRGAIPLVFWYMAVPVSLILKYHAPMVQAEHLTEWLVLGWTAGLMLWDFVKKDVFGPMVMLVSLVMMTEARVSGCRALETVWYLLTGIYAIRFAGFGHCRRAAYTISMFLFTGAFLRQPWVAWPELVEMEMRLLPVAGNIYGLGRIWKDQKGIDMLQAAGYLGCLLILAMDAVCTGALADALILEGICLAVFFLAHMAGSRRWVKISGGFLIGVAVYMTKDFWMSIAWWVYLMAAGIGLILFAAIREKKRDQDDELC